MNKTKIIATVGPSTTSLEMITNIIVNGVDAIRINGSYATFDFCDDIIAKVALANEKTGRHVAIILDIPGPLIRVGKLENNLGYYKQGEKIRIYTREIIGDNTKFSIDYENLSNEISVGKTIKGNDGLVEFRVLSKEIDCLVVEVVKEGYLSEGKSINIPDVKLERPFLSPRDIEFINYAHEKRLDFIALSFVNSADDVLDVSDLLIKLGNNHLGLISKIENNFAVEDIDKIIKVSDGIMIARGDLGVEIAIERIPGIQKKIISKCHKSGKISIVATEMLSNMTNFLNPTRAEVSDVANAVLDGADVVMLSGETTIGKYPIETVKMMERIIKAAEVNIDYEYLLNVASSTEDKSVTGSIAFSVASIANKLDCKAIFAPTNSGYTAKKISRFRPSSPIIAISPNEETVRTLALSFGVRPFLISDLKNLDIIIDKSKEFAIRALNLQPKDIILITGGYPFKKVKYTNFMNIEEI